MNRFKVTFYLRSGNSFSVVCSDMTFKRNSEGKLTSYKFDGLKDKYADDLIALDLNQIEALVSRRLRFWES